MTRSQLNHDIRALAHGRRLNLEESAYREIVRSVTGKSHITECNDREAQLVLTALRKMEANVGTVGVVRTNVAQQSMISKLGYILGWSWKEISAFCERIVNVRDTRRCNAEELSKVIRGMVGVIDHDLSTGKITMSHTERFEYEQHARPHREKQPSPPGDGTEESISIVTQPEGADGKND